MMMLLLYRTNASYADVVRRQEFLDERFPEKRNGATSSASESIWKMRRQPPFPFEQTTQNEQRGNTVELVVEEDG